MIVIIGNINWVYSREKNKKSWGTLAKIPYKVEPCNEKQEKRKINFQV